MSIYPSSRWLRCSNSFQTGHSPSQDRRTGIEPKTFLLWVMAGYCQQENVTSWFISSQSVTDQTHRVLATLAITFPDNYETEEQPCIYGNKKNIWQRHFGSPGGWFQRQMLRNIFTPSDSNRIVLNIVRCFKFLFLNGEVAAGPEEQARHAANQRSRYSWGCAANCCQVSQLPQSTDSHTSCVCVHESVWLLKPILVSTFYCTCVYAKIHVRKVGK